MPTRHWTSLSSSPGKGSLRGAASPWDIPREWECLLWNSSPCITRKCGRLPTGRTARDGMISGGRTKTKSTFRMAVKEEKDIRECKAGLTPKPGEICLTCLRGGEGVVRDGAEPWDGCHNWGRKAPKNGRIGSYCRKQTHKKEETVTNATCYFWGKLSVPVKSSDCSLCYATRIARNEIKAKLIRNKKYIQEANISLIRTLPQGR